VLRVVVIAMTKTDALSQLPADLQQLEAELDPEMQFRPLLPRAAWLVAALLLALSGFHYYTAGFGLLPETTHRGIHIAFVLGLIFLVFSARRGANRQPPGPPVSRRSGRPHRLDIGDRRDAGQPLCALGVSRSAVSCRQSVTHRLAERQPAAVSAQRCPLSPSF
jgi:TRAP-type uncharacterized transport system fused permease subunit